uniref:Plastocyanin-like domain-containing protein n=1 Tax=Fagus sylvatica TaxID=28930 RepID=A0A2N9IQZ1_FAGSY
MGVSNLLLILAKWDGVDWVALLGYAPSEIGLRRRRVCQQPCSKPPVKFDYTNPNISLDESLIYAPKATKVKKLKYNSTVEIVLQNTAFVGIENHPIHLHGFNFHVLAQGFGNYDSVNDQEKFNLVNPQARNTIVVPVGGWAVIRFQANNPGIWLAHCHLDVHLPWGLAMAFEVENGPTLSSTLPPPPIDLPQC